MSIGIEPPFIGGYRKPIYSRQMTPIRITYRSIKPWFSSILIDIGCTLLSIQNEQSALYSNFWRKNTISSIFFSELREKYHVDDTVFLVDGAPWLHAACHRHGLRFQHVTHGNRNAVERVFREVERRTNQFSNTFSHVKPKTAENWLQAFAFAWNQLI